MLLAPFISLIIFGTAHGFRRDKSNTLTGVNLRATAMQIPPINTISVDEHGNKTYGGLNADFMDWIENAATNTTYEWVEIDIESQKNYGILGGCLDMVKKGKADICTLGMSPDPDIDVDWTSSLLVVSYHFLTPYPKAESRLYGPIRPYQLQVWGAILVTLVCLPFAFGMLSTLYSLHKRSSDSSKERISFKDSLMLGMEHTIRIIIDQGGAMPDYFIHMRIFNGAWLLMAIILISGYKGNLISYLTIPKLRPMPSTFEELAKRPDLQLMVEYNTQFSDMILEAESGPLKIVGDSLRENPSHLFRTREAGDQLWEGSVSEGGEPLVYAGVDMLIEWLNSYYNSKSRTCRATMAKKPTNSVRMIHWALAKNLPYKDDLSKRIQRTWESGLNNYWYQSYRPPGRNCRIDYRPKTRNKPLTLNDLSSAFVLLGIGIGLSFLIFLVERVIAAQRHRHQVQIIP